MGYIELNYPDFKHPIKSLLISEKPYFSFRDIIIALIELNEKHEDSFSGLMNEYIAIMDDDEFIDILEEKTDDALSERFVSEPGLYRIIMRDSSAACRRFQKWIFNDVIPSLRKYGCYPPPISSQEKSDLVSSTELIIHVANNLLNEIRERERLEKEVNKKFLDQDKKIEYLYNKIIWEKPGPSDAIYTAKEFIVKQDIENIDQILLCGWAIKIQTERGGFKSDKVFVNGKEEPRFEENLWFLALEKVRNINDG